MANCTIALSLSVVPAVAGSANTSRITSLPSHQLPHRRHPGCFPDHHDEERPPDNLDEKLMTSPKEADTKAPCQTNHRSSHSKCHARTRSDGDAAHVARSLANRDVLGILRNRRANPAMKTCFQAGFTQQN